MTLFELFKAELKALFTNPVVVLDRFWWRGVLFFPLPAALRQADPP